MSSCGTTAARSLALTDVWGEGKEGRGEVERREGRGGEGRKERREQGKGRGREGGREGERGEIAVILGQAKLHVRTRFLLTGRKDTSYFGYAGIEIGSIPALCSYL